MSETWFDNIFALVTSEILPSRLCVETTSIPCTVFLFYYYYFDFFSLSSFFADCNRLQFNQETWYWLNTKNHAQEKGKLRSIWTWRKWGNLSKWIPTPPAENCHLICPHLLVINRESPPSFFSLQNLNCISLFAIFLSFFQNILFIANFEVTQNYSLIKALPSGFGAFAIWFFLDDPVSIFRWLIWQSQTATEFRPLHLIVSICPVHTAT